jgi:hypothetical protein
MAAFFTLEIIYKLETMSETLKRMVIKSTVCGGMNDGGLQE